ncbi:structural protein [Halodesulfovibrio marinisediminis]|uniref:Structural protein P5 n=1 Tax=Halodesulfovibrio marinisediminis DSM 17456 TaxID=1121457 RepID=A0A1N6DQ02_9BACT|nr:structural protein [Halodesulfovibrio marinisediminis]SIN72797.1 hypothetical protein SAMN02745161_0377 [Halodesulfovibrio marinisediminis DSM 17456]
MDRMPRGIRNNNPGNIRHGEDWKGLAEDQPDDAFCTFVDPQYGIRAMGRVLLNYQRRHGINTVEGIVNRWAPPVENDTGAYVAHVAQRLGVNAEEPIVVTEHLEDLVTALIVHENGVNPYDVEVIMEGCQMARV